jgi:hypothetical protein
MTLATLTISKATPEQTLGSRKRTYVHWHKGLDIDRYLQRDAILDNFEHAKDGKLTTWQAFFMPKYF